MIGLLFAFLFGFQIHAKRIENFPSSKVEIHHIKFESNGLSYLLVTKDHLEQFTDASGASMLVLLHFEMLSPIQKSLYEKKVTLGDAQKSQIQNWSELQPRIIQTFDLVKKSKSTSVELRKWVDQLYPIVKQSTSMSAGKLQEHGWFEFMEAIAQASFRVKSLHPKLPEKSFQVSANSTNNVIGMLYLTYEMKLLPTFAMKRPSYNQIVFIE